MARHPKAIAFQWGMGNPWAPDRSSKSRTSPLETGAHVHRGIAAKRPDPWAWRRTGRQSCPHGTRWPSSGPGAAVMAHGVRTRAEVLQVPCVVLSRLLLARPTTGACIRSPSSLIPPLATSGFGNSDMLSLYAPVAIAYDVINAYCATGCRLISLFRSRMRWLLVAFEIVQYIFVLASPQSRMRLPRSSSKPDLVMLRTYPCRQPFYMLVTDPH